MGNSISVNSSMGTLYVEISNKVLDEILETTESKNIRVSKEREVEYSISIFLEGDDYPPTPNKKKDVISCLAEFFSIIGKEDLVKKVRENKDKILDAELKVRWNLTEVVQGDYKQEFYEEWIQQQEDEEQDEKFQEFMEGVESVRREEHFIYDGEHGRYKEEIYFENMIE